MMVKKGKILAICNFGGNFGKQSNMKKKLFLWKIASNAIAIKYILEDFF